MTQLALGAKGFRPFFLLAGAFATLVAPVWMLVWTGQLVPRGPLQGMVWHAHEMIYGFTLAVIAGFLLTAVSNWTRRETVVGAPLLLLAATWLAARLALLWVPGWWGPALNLLFIPGVALALGRPLVSARSRRNYAFLVLLAALWLTNVAIYADVAGWLPGAAIVASRSAVHLVTVIILAVTGRVVPMFTRNTTGVASIRRAPAADALAIGATAALAVFEGLGFPVAVGVLSAVAGVAAFARMAWWGTLHTLRHPLLWVLHLGHAAVAAGLLLGAVRLVAFVPFSVPIHAVTVGGIGLLTIGMMARVSLGHGGRPLRIGPSVVLAFVAVAVAALARVIVPWLLPAHTLDGLWLAAMLWSVGFGIFTVVYWPVLWLPRADGKPG